MFLCAVCVTSAFDLRKDAQDILFSFNLKKYKNSDEASLLFWNWLLKQTKLTVQTAALHNIYQKDASAIFVDLNNDNSREIVGTHYSSAINGDGDCHLYILRYDPSLSKKYKKISKKIYFNAEKQVDILLDTDNGYHKIRVYTHKNINPRIYSYNKKRDLYEP